MALEGASFCFVFRNEFGDRLGIHMFVGIICMLWT